jgi:hypothetical protein
MSDIDEAIAGRLNPARISEINLEQALLDFEVANARVLDLTRRLTELTNELLTTRQQLAESRLHASQTRTELALVQEDSRLIKTSLAYRGLRLIGDVRGRIGH